MAITQADKALANQRNAEYAYQVWGLVAPVLFLVGVIHYGSFALGMLFPSKRKAADVEADGRVVRHGVSIRRLPLAIVNAYRVLAFRMTLTIGPFSLNLTEVALTIVYIAALFVWTFVNSTYCGIPFIRELKISDSHVSRRDEIRASILYESLGEHCMRPAPTRRRTWHQEQHRWM
jgi:hypothetical protein